MNFQTFVESLSAEDLELREIWNFGSFHEIALPFISEFHFSNLENNYYNNFATILNKSDKYPDISLTLSKLFLKPRRIHYHVIKRE